MSHKNNKNSKDNKKAGEKTKSELHKMKIETANEPDRPSIPAARARRRRVP